MKSKERIAAFAELGAKINNLTEDELSEICGKAESSNPWFTPASTKRAFDGIAHFLQQDKLDSWVAKYEISELHKTVGIVMAGNIPMVGFHDMLCVLVSGNRVAAKTSSNDHYLISLLRQWLMEINPEFENLISIVERLHEAEAVIATGSDNTARYFRYYFKNRPHIIRQNRTSIAVLDGSETSQEILGLADDFFSYFGLGCRNVSKIFVPEEYDFQTLLDQISDSPYSIILEHYKYKNNYDYNKSIYLVNGDQHLDTGFMLLKEDKALISPTSVLFFQLYASEAQLQLNLAENQHKIQCIVSHVPWLDGAIPLGSTQKPELEDYADGVDTMEFLAGLI